MNTLSIQRKLTILTALLLTLTLLSLTGCGKSKSAPTTTNSLTKPVTITGTVSFPTTATTPATLSITDLTGNVIAANPTLTISPTNPKQYTYSAALDPTSDYMLTASWGGQVLRAVADQTTTFGTTTPQIDVSPTSSTATIMIEQSMALTPGTLGKNATSTQAQTATISLVATSPADIAKTITSALLASNSKSNSLTPTQTNIASLANIVTAATMNNVDPAAFIAGSTTTPSISALTYAPTGVSSISTVTPTGANSIAAATSTATQSDFSSLFNSNSSSSDYTTFTIGNAGSYTIFMTGTLSISGALPTGITFNPSTGVLSGTPATGSNGLYPLVFTATQAGLTTTSKTLNLIIDTPAPTGYKNSALSGIWLLPAGVDNNYFFDSDGTGNITTYGLSSNTKGTYLVYDTGSFTMNFGSNIYFGALDSAITGTVASATAVDDIINVTNLAACQGTWNEPDSIDLGPDGERTIVSIGSAITVDASGNIKSTSGLSLFPPPLTGKMFCLPTNKDVTTPNIYFRDYSTVVAIITSGTSSNKFKLDGKLINNILYLQNSVDASGNQANIGSLVLTKQ